MMPYGRHQAWLGLALALGLAAGARADLTKARAESNFDKRSKLALENADATFESMRAAYEKGDNQQVAADAAEIRESVELAYESLASTGKDPRKNPKWFKRAEIDTRNLLRRLDAFQQDMSFNDRPMLDGVKASVQQVHDKLLIGLMEGKPK